MDSYSPDKESVEMFLETVSDMTMTQLIKTVPDIFDLVHDPVQLEIAKSAFLDRASRIGDPKLISNVIKTCESQIKTDERLTEARINRSLAPAYVTLGARGEPLETIENFFNIMSCDPFYKGVKYNLLTNQAEITRQDKDGEIVTAWSDTEEAHSMNFIESNYKLFSIQKHTAALRMLFRMREYHPIMDLIEGLQWDGVNRIEHCLTRWMLAEDSEYTREVSRLIFAGGINRLYNPGCKFDDVPVLVGTKQGEGKSTFIRWLAINEQWFTEVKKVEGDSAIEALFGAWICEIPELSAFKKADDVESIKAFITRTKDKYRKPYDRNPMEYPRRCVLVGSTNSDQFLTDKSGNRRFYPVVVHSSGYDLFDHEQECKEYIIQCWAEARERYKKGEMPPFANRKLLHEYQEKQAEAMEDDWRVGKISAWLDRFNPGDKVCAIQIWRECLSVDGFDSPKKNESREIGQIMNKMPGWEKCTPYRSERYGTQRGWIKTVESAILSADELPF